MITKKVGKKLLILMALIVINAVGFVSARYYFTTSESQTTASVDIIKSAAKSSTTVVNTNRFLGLGLDLLRKFGN